jgi:hypothetical protein
MRPTIHADAELGHVGLLLDGQVDRPRTVATTASISRARRRSS